ncbi:MAG: hypothetical protein ACREO5_03875 [Candidatus Binatia bacterium]
MCRKCYIHPANIDSYADGSLLRVLGQRVKKEITDSLHDLEPEEAAMLGLPHQRLKDDTRVSNTRLNKTSSRRCRDTTGPSGGSR